MFAKRAGQPMADVEKIPFYSMELMCSLMSNLPATLNEFLAAVRKYENLMRSSMGQGMVAVLQKKTEPAIPEPPKKDTTQKLMKKILERIETGEACCRSKESRPSSRSVSMQERTCHLRAYSYPSEGEMLLRWRRI